MTEPEFIIRVTDLDAGGRELRMPVRPTWVRAALEEHEPSAGTRDGELVIRASMSGSDVVIHGTLDAELTVPCARCLEPVALPIHSDLSVIYVPRSKLKAEGGEADGDTAEADILGYDGETVVLDELVRDELVLEVPMIPLCSEACPGMSPAPGIEKSEEPAGIDPRLAPLLAFQGAFQRKTSKD